MAQKTRLGIIGAGRMAGEHLNVIRALPDVEVTGIASLTRPKAEALAAQFNIPSVFDDAKSLMEHKNVDGVLVLVSDDQMHQVASTLIPYRIPLFIEKPPGLTPQLTFQLAELAKTHKTLSMVGYNRRYYSVFHKGLAKIKEFGPLLGVSIEGHERMWRVREMGIFKPAVLDHWLYANSTHTIDLVRFFSGEVRDMKAFGNKTHEALGDQFVASMRMDSGALAQYQAFWYSPGGWRVTLYGEGVTVEFKPLEKGTWAAKDLVAHEILPDAEDVSFKPGLYRQMQAFVHMIRDGQGAWPLLDLASSYKTMALAQQLADSVTKDKP